MTDARSLSRHARAAVFAAVCVVLAAAGHAWTSGRHIPLPTLIAAFATTGAAAWLAAGRQRGLLPIGTGLLAVQAALHAIFDDGQWSVQPHKAHDMAGTAAATGMDAVRGVTGTAGGPGAPLAHTGAAGHSPEVMLVAHVLAAVCCALWLWRGEAAFFRLLRCLGAFAFTPLRLLLAAAELRPAPRPVRPRFRPAAAGPGRSLLLAHVLSRRGPPYSAVFSHTTPTGPPVPGF
ncbi:hypothetical protein [Streptomyces sp. 8N706]|uniref:hypothetical protein n=1 Tax=Streptomyces sp. 8N706 TaxID=3457416 RepID=UPI003FCF7507